MSKLTPYTFDDLFHPLDKGTSKLTSYAVYRSLAYPGKLVPLWGGNSEHITESQFVSVNAKNQADKPIKIFKGPCLIVSLDGSAGSMTYKDENAVFALNHHAGVLYVKDPAKLNLEYFKYRYEQSMQSLAVSDGSKTLSKQLIEKQAFELPSLEDQLSILTRYKRLDAIRAALHSSISKLEKLKSQNLDSDDSGGDNVTLSDLFDIVQGHQITDLELYMAEGGVPVYTGNNEVKGHWDKTLIDEDRLPCLSYPSKANSGVVFIQNEIFDANNTALLIPKKQWREKLILEWFRMKLPALFLDAMTSKEGVSYLNKEIVETLNIIVPSKSEQEKEATYLSRIESLEEHVSPILDRIEVLLNKQVLL